MGQVHLIREETTNLLVRDGFLAGVNLQSEERRDAFQYVPVKLLRLPLAEDSQHPLEGSSKGIADRCGPFLEDVVVVPSE